LVLPLPKVLPSGMNVKWHGVCSLDALAAAISEKDFIVSTDARRKERFWARYQGGKRVNEPQVCKASELEKLELPIFNEGEYFQIQFQSLS
jgi:tRNA A37 threonylcarbamoyladenosine modification protein TsaB